MNSLTETSEFKRLVADFFSDPNRRRKFEKDAVVIGQGKFNDTLYMVISGRLTGIFENPEGNRFRMFTAGPEMFVGVYSFFSGTFQGSSTVTAAEPSEVAFIHYRDIEEKIQAQDCLASRFMPVIMDEMLYRQRRLQKIYQEKEQTLRKLMHSKQMASLGQMAAGISHELNNAIAVIERNAQWLSKHVQNLLKKTAPDTYRFADIGMQKGRSLSSREARRRGHDLQQKILLTDNIVRRLAQIDMPDNALAEAAGNSQLNAEQILENWEIGAAFHDVLIAVRQAIHVVGSVKILGAGVPPQSDPVDLNESLQETLALMRSPLHGIKVRLDLKNGPKITANRGELVQIWTNLIRNACESMTQARVATPELGIATRVCGRYLQVCIKDNGPGITPEMLSKIFQPDITTKVSGLSFGLGLGLAIVSRLVDNCHGSISVESEPGKTLFKVELPMGGISGE